MPRGFTDKAIAAAAGRKGMSRRTSDQQQKAANTLILQHGVGYFSALGKASAAARAKRT